MPYFIFSEPLYLLFLLLIPLIYFMHFFSLKRVKGKVLKFGNFEALAGLPINKIVSKKYLWLFFKIFIIILLIFSLSGIKFVYNSNSSALSIILAIDSSSSMSINDYQPNRLEAAKQGAKAFLDNSPASLEVGVISFAGEPFIISQLTEDKSYLKSEISNLNLSRTGGTNLGGAIISGVNLLQEVKDKSKNIILLTDGQSTVGTPISTAVKYANENAVSINTIGIGTEQGGTLEQTDAILVLDEGTLINISSETGGNYFKVNDEQELENIYQELAATGTGKATINLSKYLLILSIFLLVLLWAVGVLWNMPVP